jgi:hypothetical protein
MSLLTVVSYLNAPEILGKSSVKRIHDPSPRKNLVQRGVTILAETAGKAAWEVFVDIRDLHGISLGHLTAPRECHDETSGAGAVWGQSGSSALPWPARMKKVAWPDHRPRIQP